MTVWLFVLLMCAAWYFVPRQGFRIGSYLALAVLFTTL